MNDQALTGIYSQTNNSTTSDTWLFVVNYGDSYAYIRGKNSWSRERG
jgi:hypothetical protein